MCGLVHKSAAQTVTRQELHDDLLKWDGTNRIRYNGPRDAHFQVMLACRKLRFHSFAQQSHRYGSVLQKKLSYTTRECLICIPCGSCCIRKQCRACNLCLFRGTNFPVENFHISEKYRSRPCNVIKNTLITFTFHFFICLRLLLSFRNNCWIFYSLIYLAHIIAIFSRAWERSEWKI